jgi:hypothetical protein
MTAPIFYSTEPATLLIAATASLAEAEALMRWVGPVLDSWPRPNWACWLVDASDCTRLRAALYDGARRPGPWRPVDAAAFMRQGDACRIMADRAGLVFFTYPAIAAVLRRQLDGLAAALSDIDAAATEAAPFRQQIRAFAQAA